LVIDMILPITSKWQPSEGWSPIIPDSMMESFYKALCSQQEKK
jgi:hypothetical protein